ncbi:MAG: hypothetical protein PWR26_1241 [Methanosarcinales archaeon]|uniref:dTMP kinase n=1 Tax=Methermicoccus shengliensis TaxID=660064 RepID=UPI0005B26F76|nr:hypothetical protein [Methermicoccus shengliensis]MDI3488524.1 hypothetical protein [Methanosarcinales archaeon]
MSKGSLICFTGIDGSGKSTLAEMLVGRMDAEGMEVRYVHNVYNSLLLRPIMELMKRTVFKGKTISENYWAFESTRNELFEKPLLSTLYKYAVLLDYIAQTVFSVKMPLIMGKNVVCDRYVYDVIVNLAVELHLSREETKRLARWCFRVLSKPDVLFLLDVPEDVAYKRKDDVPSIEYLRERKRVYMDVAEDGGIIRLDGTKSVDELGVLAWEKMCERLRGEVPCGKLAAP